VSKLTVATYPGEDGYVIAECIEIPGCLSQGKTKQQALRNIQDAIQECLSVMLEDFVKQHRPKSEGNGKERRTVRVRPPQVELVHG
jgi:predicted RNase H-like HicB family nuclease